MILCFAGAWLQLVDALLELLEVPRQIVTGACLSVLTYMQGPVSRHEACVAFLQLHMGRDEPQQL